jgi:hypothetical protein
MEAKVSVESSVAQTGTAGLAVSRQIAMIRAKAAQGKMTQLTAEGTPTAQQAIVLIVVISTSSQLTCSEGQGIQ